MNQAEYAACDGVALARLIASGEVTTKEVRLAAIQAIEDKNPVFNCVIATNFDVPEAQSSSNAAGSLAGAPFLLKDVNLYSSDMPTTFGSAFFKGAKARTDSTIVSRWRQGGLQILGKTNSPEFAAEFVTEPRAYGIAINPRAPELTAGGSSGGAAAAVAAGMVPIAHATDLGGSIRIPAACCGVFGFKPTAGLNSVGPHFKQIAGGLNSDHVITRTVRDSAASLDVTADGGGHYLRCLERPTGRLKIGLCDRTPSGDPVQQAQREAVNAAAYVLENLGHDLVEYHYPDGLDATDWFDHLWIFDIVELVNERRRDLGRDPAEDELEPLTWRLIDKALRGGRGAYNEAQIQMKSYAARYLGSMRGIDLLLTPSLATDPQPIGSLSFDAFQDLDAWGAAGYSFAPFSIPSNISGQPSATFPFTCTAEGVPVGVQISGRPSADLLVLQVCRQLEAAVSAREIVEKTAAERQPFRTISGR